MYYKYNTLDIHYEKYGNGEKNIIILPGFGNTRKTFDYMINYLKEKYTVYIFDYPGFGKTKHPTYPLTIYDYARIINSFIKEKELKNVYLIGHSFGGRIIILINSYYENNYKAILINSAGIRRKSLKNFRYKFLKKLKFFYKNKQGYLERLYKKYASDDYKSISINMKKTFKNIVNENLTSYLKQIKAETLIIWGKSDKDTPIKDGKLMKRRIKSSELITLNTGHFTYLEEPFLVNKIIDEFIKNANY